MDASSEWRGDCMPSEQLFGSREDLCKAINRHAMTRGYAFVTGRSTKEKTKRITVTYQCDRSCPPPDASIVRKRRTSTKGTNCPFSVLAVQKADQNTWALVHRPDPKHATHNHSPSAFPSAHAIHRKLTQSDRQTVQELSNARIQIKDIQTVLLNGSGTLATKQDISSKHCPQQYDDLRAAVLAPAHPVAQPVAQPVAEGIASLSSQQPAMQVTQEAAMAPSVEAPAVVHQT